MSFIGPVARVPAESTLLTSAARTTDQSLDQVNYGYQGVILHINVTAGTGFNITPKIRFKDPISGTYVDVLVGAAIVATGHAMLMVGSGITAVTNLVAAVLLPRNWNFLMDHADATSVTYSVAAILVP